MLYSSTAVKAFLVPLTSHPLVPYNLPMNHWLVKSEPAKYSWEKFCKDKRTYWDGVRNFQARNNLKTMKEGDEVLFYHGNEGMEVVGVARVIKEHYPDPTSDEPAWVVVDLEPVKTLKKSVPLAEIKKEKQLQNITLIKQGRLSVISLTKEEFETIVKMGSGK